MQVCKKCAEKLAGVLTAQAPGRPVEMPPLICLGATSNCHDGEAIQPSEHLEAADKHAFGWVWSMCLEQLACWFVGFFFYLEWSVQCGWERKVTFAKMHYWSLFMLWSRRACWAADKQADCRLVANKDFLQYLVDQPLPCCMKPQHPDMLQHQRMSLLLLWGSSVQYLHEPQQKLSSHRSAMKPIPSSKAPHLTLTVLFSQAGLKAACKNSSFSVNGKNFPEFKLWCLLNFLCQ